MTRKQTSLPPTSVRLVAQWALILALPLLVVGLVAAQLLDADYVVTRQRAYAVAEDGASRLRAAASAALMSLVDPVFRRLATAQADGDAVLVARSLVYGNAATAILIRREGRSIFPPEEGWDLTADSKSLHAALNAAAGLQRDSANAGGWFPGPGGPTFFQCRSDAAKTTVCVALDWAHVEGALRAAFEDAAVATPGFSFRVRDPFDGLVWSRGGLDLPSGDIFVSSGKMQGWRIAVAGASTPSWGALTRIALATPIAIGWLALVWALVRRQRDRVAATLARGALTAQLSHDLRTPLANLKLYTELIERQVPAGDGKLSGYCRVIHEEIDRLDTLAGATMTLGTTPHPVRLDVGVPDEIVRNAVARLGELLDASGCRCELEEGAGRTCRFDRAGFERILVNLIENARKYAPGTISVTTALDAGGLRLSVRDWGSGFAASSRQGQGYAQGVGIGLSVVRDLARANGGEVAIVDCCPGSRVDVTMRATRVAPA